ncbi:MAG: NUDIX domain-containing protein [Verrucomicrobiales bacterium]
MAAKQKAAAICYRESWDSIEFLLVRSRTGNRWTFPKGGVEPSDASPGAAAAREAREEAGVSGQVDPKLLAIFRHWAGTTPSEPGHEQPVAAYLLHVKELSGEAEAGRDPKWFTVPEAFRAIESNPLPPEYNSEMRRAIEAALDRLRPADSAPEA